MYVILSDDEWLDGTIEYANDDIDLLELALILLEQMECGEKYGFPAGNLLPVPWTESEVSIDSEVESADTRADAEAPPRILPMLAYSA